MAYFLGVDTGGTYTDAVIVDEAADTVIGKAKSLTTRQDLALGIGRAVDAALEGAGIAASDVALVSLSTTLATNALVEGQGGRVALIFIGFDAGDMERGGLTEALKGDPVVLLDGGHTHAGTEAATLDIAGLEAQLLDLRDSVMGFAVAARFATRNPAHEIAAREVIRRVTGRPVTCSHELSANLNGPKRALTAVLNARLIGMIDRLVTACERHLAQVGIDAPLMVVRGDGALISASMVRERPIETILSGPAASIVGARWLTGAPDALVSDIGGTTTDVALKLLARRRNGAGDRFATDGETLATAIIEQLTAQTVDCLLEAAFDEDDAFDGQASEVLARHPLMTAGLEHHRGVVELTARLGVPVIGLGASAPSYYGAVGKVLGCEMILPEHAGVANAIGAVVGQVSQKVTGIVTSPAEGRFIAHLPDALQTFSSATEALAALESALRLEAETRAKAAGAEDLRITAKRDLREVDIEGRKMFVEASVSVTAAGRPRVAHS